MSATELDVLRARLAPAQAARRNSTATYCAAAGAWPPPAAADHCYATPTRSC
ncbi:MAG TPA: hypothetical protein VNV66_08025 [Pilimelia sp.]|nr:hypothetical protein [Pilimelia sp.]